jgi:biotin carboxyl carrier protein
MNPDIEVKLNDHLAKVQILSEDGNILKVLVDGKKYELDLIAVEDCIYSILYKNKSYSVELIEGENDKTFTANTLYQSFNIEIIDAESRYLANRDKTKGLGVHNVISSPMPGRIVRIPVTEGQIISEGQTVIVVSAMKMESEYKSSKDGMIKHIHVKEGDVVNGHQPLITIE